MSKKEIRKPTWVDACDLCNKEITRDERSESASIVRQYQSSITNTKTAKHLWFKWVPSLEMRVKRDTTEICYDFHASCFDKLIHRYLRGSR